MHQAVEAVAAPVVDGLLKRVQDKVRDQGRGDPPATRTAKELPTDYRASSRPYQAEGQ